MGTADVGLDHARGMVGDPEGILAGGGELGERMRAIAWADTPLGPVAQWPRALKTCVRILLTSRQPMWLGWGDELTYLYNDPYRAIVGGKHPWALGRPTAEVWREIWEDIEPRITATLTGGEGTYDEALLLLMERHGYREETYYTFSYSPVPDDTGRVCGIFCANSDDTRSIIGERQLALLRDLAAGAAEARTIADACTMSMASLETNRHDMPFALLYLAETERQCATLAGLAGIARDHPLAAASLALDGTAPWPIGDVLDGQGAGHIPDLSSLPGPLPAGAWDRPPGQAVALPLAPAGQSGRNGVLLVGLSPYRLFDDDYRRFLDLVAGRIAASISAAQAYEEERARAEALAELDRAKTAFFANVSHEFRTPLTLLLGPLEDLLQGDLAADQREELQIAHRNGLRLLRLVNSLLDFSRLEAGRVQAAFAPTDLPALTADLASTFRSAIERVGLRFVVDLAPLPPGITTYVDREMWEKIVLNLLSNAFKFTIAGEIAVSLRATEHGRAVQLLVRDTGTGVPAQELPRLFERFHRVQGARARTHEGTGIGLALVQELVHLHGGTIAVDSAEGRGTTFTVTMPTGAAHLPAAQVESAATPLASVAAMAATYVEEAQRWTVAPVPDAPVPGDEAGATPPGEAAPAPEARPRVLLADDNADMRDYVARLLHERFAVETAADGRAALAAALARPPDLVLSDVMMPHLDGFGLLRALRADPRTDEIPIILLSARAGEEARVEGLDAGADDYLIKPFSAREMLARVGAHLSLSRARREATRREQSARAEAEVERGRLRELFMQAPAAICILGGPEHVFTLANPRYLALIGGRDVLGKPMREALPELAGQGIYELLDDVYRTGRAFIGDELRIELARGESGGLEEVYFNFVYAPFRGADGAMEGIFVHAYEVSDQVRARRQLEAEVAERARAEGLLAGQRMVLELIARGVPLEETLTALARLIEREADELSCSILLLDRAGEHLHLGAAPSLPADYNRAIDGIAIGPSVGSCGTAAYLGEAVIVADIATDPRWEDFRALALAHQLRACWSTPIHGAAGNVLGTFAVYAHEPRAPHPRELALVATLTYLAGIAIERHRSDEERAALLRDERVARAEAEAAVHARDTFLSIAAHELRTPVTSLQGTVQLIERRRARGNLNEERLSAHLATLTASAARLTSLTDDLLDVARLRTGQMPIRRQPLDLGGIVRAVSEQIWFGAGAAHRLVLDLAEPLPIVAADAARIEQVITNLLTNAIKYAPDGGAVTVSVAPREGGLAVAVRDEGIGLPPGTAEAIFEPFGRAENAAASNMPGMGLGLYICRSIIARHDGWIAAASDGEGRGTTVTFWLPSAPPAG